MISWEAGSLSTEDSSFAITRDYIAYHAVLHPSDIAVIDNNNKITYAQFHQDLERFILAARSFELEVGNSAAVEWTSLYLHWLLVLSFETLGIATFSYTKEIISESRSLLTSVDLVVCTEDAVPENTVRAHAITQSWIDEVFALEPNNDLQYPVIYSDTPGRMHYGSGTTGKPSILVKSARVHEFKIWQYQLRAGCNRDTRFLVTLPFSIQASYVFATVCIRMGGTCIYDANNIAQAISDHDITHVSMVPLAITRELNSLPKNYVKPNNLTVFIFGGPISSIIRDRVQSEFSANVIETYSAGEVGIVCIINADGIGAVFPGVRVEVVDENDQPQIGQPGRVRIKSDGSIAGYYDDLDATKRRFQNGWFYPGDAGIMINSHAFKLLERLDDLINVGGMKINPVEIEDQLNKLISVKDLCVTSTPDNNGNGQVCIALVPDSSTNFQDLSEIIKPKFSKSFGTVVLIEVNEIPRTSGGKAKRNLLKSLILERQRSPSTSQ